MTYDADVLARQLAQLGRDLDEEVKILGELEEEAADAGGEYQHRNDLYEDTLASCLLKSGQSNAESRKAEARLQCIAPRAEMRIAQKNWEKAKAAVRTQEKNLTALHKRIDIGRSLLSREKALIGLSNSGVDT